MTYKYFPTADGTDGSWFRVDEPEETGPAAAEEVFSPSVERAAELLIHEAETTGLIRDDVRNALAVALDDGHLAPRISTWRHTPCDHSRVLNPKEHRDGDTAEYEQACSPCLRDRLLAHILGGAS